MLPLWLQRIAKTLNKSDRYFDNLIPLQLRRPLFFFFFFFFLISNLISLEKHRGVLPQFFIFYFLFFYYFFFKIYSMNVEVFYDICSSKIRSMFLILQSYSLVYTQLESFPD
jgi:hypothetical protein